jgi:putative colanic acid biosynthesis UDP-glucose lipid carrier transferase
MQANDAERANGEEKWSARVESEMPATGTATLLARNGEPGILARWAPLRSLFMFAATPIVVLLSLYGLVYGMGGTVSGQVLIAGVVAALVASYVLKDEQDVFYVRRAAFQAAFALFCKWSLVLLALLGLGSMSGFQHDIAVNVLTAWAVVTPFFLLLSRKLIHHAARYWPVSTRRRRTAVIVGASAGKEEVFVSAIREVNNSGSGITLKGFFDDRSAHRINIDPAENLGKIDEVGEYVWRYHINIIFVTLPMTSHPRVVSLIESLKDTTASVYFVPSLAPFSPIQSRADQFAGVPIIAVYDSPFDGRNGILKRAFDLSVGTLLLVLTLPVTAIVSAVVKLTSTGPVFFTQNRYGLDGHVIRVYKFRTMTVQEDGDEVIQATPGDSRTTTVGAFLRKTSLDELPQLINVIQGRMSLVGPRPHACAHNEQYRKLIRGYMLRHKVRPGMTGLAQVNGFRGGTQTVEKMRGRIEYDLDYLRRWSLFLDIKIMLKTAILVLNDRSAY